MVPEAASGASSRFGTTSKIKTGKLILANPPDAPKGSWDMGVDVVLMGVQQRGTSPRKRQLSQVESVQDEGDLFAELCGNSRLPMLSRVDRYRTRILTRADMAQFVSEVDATHDLVPGPRERDRLAAIRRLAERCAAGVDLELHLQGD